MRKMVLTAVILLAIFHQDVWLWDDATLVWGGLPVGLAYHVLFSLLSAIVWALAVAFAWPTDVEDEVKETLADQETASAT